LLAAISIAMSMVRPMLHCITKVVADLPGNLDLNRVALLPRHLDTDLSGDLVGVLDWLLVALPVFLSMALGSAGVSTIARLSISLGFRFSLSLTLLISISTMSYLSMRHNLRFVTNNSRAVVDLCVSCVTLGGECFLTLLNVGGVNNSFTDRTGNLALRLDWLLVTLSVLLVLTVRSCGVSRLCLSLSLTLAISISSLSMGNNLRVMTNNSRAVVNLLGCLLAVSGDDVLALLDVSGVYDDIIFLMALLTLVLDWLLMALLVWLAEALKVVMLFVSISWFSLSLSFTLSISAVSMRNNLRVMTNNSRAVVNLL